MLVPSPACNVAAKSENYHVANMHANEAIVSWLDYYFSCTCRLDFHSNEKVNWYCESEYIGTRMDSFKSLNSLP